MPKKFFDSPNQMGIPHCISNQKCVKEERSPNINWTPPETGMWLFHGAVQNVPMTLMLKFEQRPFHDAVSILPNPDVT
jgi:hypothetical protein